MRWPTFKIRDLVSDEYTEFTGGEDEVDAYAERWIRESYDLPEGAPIWIDVEISRDGEVINEVEVQLDPEAPDCTEAEHAWTSGPVQGSGGGVKWTDTCDHCGARRHTDTFATRPDTGTRGHEVVTYDPP